MVPKEKGSWRFILNVARGFDFEGGHNERDGLDTSGNVIDVLAHKHSVSLDFTRIAPEIQYTFGDGWDIWLRVPYNIKEQTVTITPVGSATSTELEAMKRNSRIHHRNETYQGWSDLKLLVAHWRTGLLRDNGALEFAFGSSIPVGKTEADPFMAGAMGEEHLHIQFGTGTFDPLLEAYYVLPLPRSFALRAYSLGRFPVYENRHSYRAPVELVSGLSVARYEVFPRTSLRAIYTLFFQGYGNWDGTRDPNSGLLSHSIVLGATVDLSSYASLDLGIRYPFGQETLSGEGDTFEQGPTLVFTMVFSLNPNW